MSERISPQDETAIREWAALVLDESRREVDRGLWMCAYTDALPTHSVRSQMLTLLAELDVLRGEVERRDELLAGFVNVVDSCDLTVNDEENVEPLLDLARRVIGEEPNE